MPVLIHILPLHLLHLPIGPLPQRLQQLILIQILAALFGVGCDFVDLLGDDGQGGDLGVGDRRHFMELWVVILLFGGAEGTQRGQVEVGGLLLDGLGGLGE